MMAEQSQRSQAATEAVNQIRERFGEGSIMKLGDNKAMNVDAISTGCLSLDIALGIGGVPRGRVIEIYGPEASGKTTLAQHIVAEVQKQGGIAAFIDAEHALDPEYAKKIGVRTKDLFIAQPDTGEQALEITETLVRSNAIDVVVIDSVAALVPKAELEGEMGDSHMGLQARLMSQALRKLAGIISKSKTTVVFINQIRMKIGVFFGNPETTTGGNALKFYASVRIEVRRAAQIKQGEKIVGNRTKAKIVKNKVAPPFKAISSISACNPRPLQKAAIRMRTKKRNSASAEKTRKNSFRTTRNSKRRFGREFSRRHLPKFNRARILCYKNVASVAAGNVLCQHEL